MLKTVGVLVALAFAAFAVRAVYLSDILAVERVEVVGTVHLSEDEARRHAAIPDGATLIRFPAREVEERMLSHPWVADVRVSRDMPDGLVIHVEERVPAALLDTGGAEMWLVDGDGRVLESRVPSGEDAFVVVRDLPEIDPVVGELIESEALENALAILGSISDVLASGVRAVSAPSVDLTTLITTNDVEILFGSAEEVERKDMVARTILGEQEGNVVHINVRTPDRPTWRGIESDG